MNQKEGERIFEACREGNVHEVQQLVNANNINAQDKSEWQRTPLFIACEFGHIEIVRLLLNQQSIDVNKINTDEKAPLFIACRNGFVEIVKLLLNDARTNVNYGITIRNTGTPSSGFGSSRAITETPLHIACELGHIEIVKLLLNNEKVGVNQGNRSQQSALTIACQFGHTEIVKLLLKNERVDMEKDVNQKAFHTASNYGKIEVLEIFLNEARMKMRKDEEERQRIEEQIRLEERRKQGPKRSLYELEYNNKLFILRTTAKTFPEFEEAIKSKIELERNVKMELYFHRKGNLFVLDDMEDLEDEMRIKALVPSQQQPNLFDNIILNNNPVEYTQSKDWNDIVFLSQGSNFEFRVEIDADGIPPTQLKTQIAELMEKSSKLESCKRFQTTIRSNIIFQIDFQTKSRAEKVFEQIVDLLESNYRK